MFNALKCVTLRNKKLLFMVFQNSTRDYVCETILKRQFQTVAIQCPDSLLQHVPEIVHQFEDSVNRIINLKEEGSQCTKKPLFVILADTASGSSCCVDIVAAKHYSADCIIHLGSACLTRPSEPFPCFYCFSELYLNLEKLTQALESFKKDHSLFSKYSLLESIVLVYEVEYHHYLHDIVKMLLKYFPQSLYVAVAETQYNVCFRDDVLPEESKKDIRSTSCLLHIVGRRLAQVNGSCIKEKDFRSTDGKIRFFLDQHDYPSISKEKTFFFFLGSFDINNMSGLFRRFALRYGSSYKILGYDPLQQSTTCEDSLSIWDSVENPSSLLPLHKVFTLRYGLIEKAKLAKMIGVIFTTVGGAYHLKVFNRLKRLCETSKKCIVSLLIGKMNVTKLENFPEIDIFCLISCPQSCFISNFKDYSKGILTPFELEVALNYREWTTDYIIENEELCREDRPFELSCGSNESSDTEEYSTLKRVDAQSLEETIPKLCPIKDRNYQGVIFTSSEDVNVYEGLSGVASGYTKEIAEDCRKN